MTIFELSVPTLAPAFRCERPFVYSCAPGDWETADYWTDTFGAPHESSSEAMHIGSFFRDGVNRYSKTSAFLSMLATERSFLWAVEQVFAKYDGEVVEFDGEPVIDASIESDFVVFGGEIVMYDGEAAVFKERQPTPRLYIHIEHDQFILGPVWQYGKTHGYCKEKALYIDDIFYSPILESIPSLAMDQDLEAYDALSFISGAVVLKNGNGDLDWMIDQPPFGFECSIARLPAVKYQRDYTRSSLVYLAALYVEDFRASLTKTTLNLQDRRKAQNIKVPTELFSATDYPNIDDSLIDKPIPLLYGTVRALEPVLLNGKAESGIVQYRIAQEVTSFGTVQVKIDDVWTTKTPASTDAATGTFSLSAADGRDGSRALDCRVLAPIGMDANPADIIEDLNSRYLGTQYLVDEYDTTEWAAAVAALEDVGIYIDSQVELYEIIRKLQGGSTVGFRYEFKSTGARTARIDDWNRALSFRISREDIANISDVEIETDSDLLAASVKVLYGHDYAEDEDLEKVDVSQKETVQLAYRQEPQLEFETLLQTEALAAECAELKAERYSIARMIATLDVHGSEYLPLRIYDVGVVELVPAGYDADSGQVSGSRRWVGVWKAIVLGVDPDISAEKNTVKLALIANVTDVVPVIVSETTYLTDESGVPLILE